MFNFTKTFSCLMTPALYSMEYTIDDVRYGFSVIGDKLFRYFLTKASKFTNGYFMQDNICSNITDLFIEQNQTINFLALDEDKLLVKDVLGWATHQEEFVVGYNTLWLESISDFIVTNGTSIIQSISYNVSDNIFSYNNKTAFYGFNGEDCNLEKFLYGHLILHDTVLSPSNTHLTLPHYNNDTDNGDYLSASLNFAKIIFPLIGFGIGMLIGKYYYKYHNNNTHQQSTNDEEMHAIVTELNNEENMLTEVKLLGNNAEHIETNEG